MQVKRGGCGWECEAGPRDLHPLESCGFIQHSVFMRQSVCVLSRTTSLPNPVNPCKPSMQCAHCWHLLPGLLKRTGLQSEWNERRMEAVRRPLAEGQPSATHGRHPQFPGEATERNVLKWLQISTSLMYVYAYIPCFIFEKYYFRLHALRVWL